MASEEANKYNLKQQLNLLSKYELLSDSEEFRKMSVMSFQEKIQYVCKKHQISSDGSHLFKFVDSQNSITSLPKSSQISKISDSILNNIITVSGNNKITGVGIHPLMIYKISDNLFGINNITSNDWYGFGNRAGCGIVLNERAQFFTNLAIVENTNDPEEFIRFIKMSKTIKLSNTQLLSIVQTNLERPLKDIYVYTKIKPSLFTKKVYPLNGQTVLEFCQTKWGDNQLTIQDICGAQQLQFKNNSNNLEFSFTEKHKLFNWRESSLNQDLQQNELLKNKQFTLNENSMSVHYEPVSDYLHTKYF